MTFLSGSFYGVLLSFQISDDDVYMRVPPPPPLWPGITFCFFLFQAGVTAATVITVCHDNVFYLSVAKLNPHRTRQRFYAFAPVTAGFPATTPRLPYCSSLQYP